MSGRYLINANAVHIPLADSSVNMVATSPPYWGLRNYGTEGQLGQEKRPDCLGWATGEACGECFVCHIVAVFREVWRVLHPAGVAWLNLGDSYAREAGKGDKFRGGRLGADLNGARTGVPKMNIPNGLKPKDLVMIPARVALALQADGWWVRSDIIWHKPNAMPESVTDRPTKSHEYIFLLTKSDRYFYDHHAVKQPVKEATIARARRAVSNNHKNTNGAPGQTPHTMSQPRSNWTYGGNKANGYENRTYSGNEAVVPDGGAQLRSVWQVATSQYKGAHFACWPPALVEPMIKAGSSEFGVCPSCRSPWKRITRKGKPEQRPDNPNAVLPYTAASGLTNGMGATTLHMVREVETVGWQPTCKCPEHTPVPAVVLDPFAGSGTTVHVARKLGRVGIGLDLNFAYLSEQAKERTGIAHEERFVNGRIDTRDYSDLFTMEPAQ